MEWTWLCRSTKPGPTTSPVTSTTVAPSDGSAVPTATTVPSSTATSATCSVPERGSTTRPPRRISTRPSNTGPGEPLTGRSDNSQRSALSDRTNTRVSRRPTVAAMSTLDNPTAGTASESSALDAAARWLDDNFARLVSEHQVPGATVAVLAGGRIATGAGGVTSLATGVDVDVDTVFQIGSITKIWTTTLVLQ